MSKLPPPLPGDHLPGPLAGRDFYVRVALASPLTILWAMFVNPILALPFNGASEGVHTVAVLLLTGAAGVVGVVCGAIALWGVRRHGSRGILLPALIGVIGWAVIGLATLSAINLVRNAH